MLLAEHRYVSSMVILNDDHLRTCTALVIRHSWGILMCVVYFILSWTISVPLCLNGGESPGQVFHAGTSYGTCHRALDRGIRTTSPNWVKKLVSGALVWKRPRN